MSINLNLTHLSNFIQVVEWGSISKAALFLNVAQPALTRQIKALEDSLGVKMLRRHSWGVEPTKNGKLLLEHARRIQRECQLVSESIQLNQKNPAGNIYLGVPSAYALSLVPSLLQRMKVAYPLISIHIVEAFSGTIHEWLVTGRLDLAVLYYSKEHDMMEAQDFIDEEMIALGAKGTFGGETKIDMTKLTDQKLIVAWRPHLHRLAIESAFLNNKISFEPGIEIDSMACMIELAHRGEGITILPPSAVTREIESRRIDGIPVSPGIPLKTVLGLPPVANPPARCVL